MPQTDTLHLLFTWGSHGDVYPIIAIGQRLQERGHAVTIVANSHFKSAVTNAGLTFLSNGTEASYLQLVQHQNNSRPSHGFRQAAQELVRQMRETYHIIAAQREAHDLVVVAPLSLWGTRFAQEKFPDLPVIKYCIQPLDKVVPKRHSLFSLGQRLVDLIILPQKLLSALPSQLILLRLKQEIDKFRRELDLPPLRTPIIRWFSPEPSVVAFFPGWFLPGVTRKASAESSKLHFTGFPYFDQGRAQGLPPDIVQFLDAGDAPIVFTSGTPISFAKSFFETSVQVCDILGCRGIFITQFEEQVPHKLPAHIRHFTYVSFHWLFQRAKAVVHHGGIGTSAQALRAGIPQLIAATWPECRNNATCLEQLTVAKSSLLSRYKAKPAAQCLSALLASPETQTKCRELSAKINQTDSVAEICHLIENAQQFL
jgi:rhamnosyltransferase subunit B